MRYDGKFIVQIAGQNVAKEAVVQLSTMHRAGDMPIHHLVINTTLTKEEYDSLVQAALKKRGENATNSNP